MLVTIQIGLGEERLATTRERLSPQIDREMKRERVVLIVSMGSLCQLCLLNYLTLITACSLVTSVDSSRAAGEKQTRLVQLCVGRVGTRARCSRYINSAGTGSVLSVEHSLLSSVHSQRDHVNVYVCLRSLHIVSQHETRGKCLLESWR